MCSPSSRKTWLCFCGLSTLLLVLILAPVASAGTLSIFAQYQGSQSDFMPPFMPFPPFDQGFSRTEHSFVVNPFTAKLQDYSEVSLTINAPTNHEFVFYALPGLTPINFTPMFFFDGGGSRRDIYQGLTSITFDGLRGTAPTLSAIQSDVSRVADSGSFFALESSYEYSSEFSFRSMTIKAIFTAGGWETKSYSAWDAKIIAYAASNSDVGPLSDLRAVPEPSSSTALVLLLGSALRYVSKRKHTVKVKG